MALATIVLVFIGSVPFNLYTIKYFEQIDLNKEEEANTLVAVTKAKEFENYVRALMEKSKLLSTLLLDAGKANKLEMVDHLEHLIANEPDLLGITIYSANEDEYELSHAIMNNKALERLGKDKSYIKRINLFKPFPIRALAQKGNDIQIATIEPEVPLMAVGVPLSRNLNQEVALAAIFYVELARVQRIFSTFKDRTVFLVDRFGNTLAHPDEYLTIEGRSLTDNPLVKAGLQDASPRGNIQYQLPVNRTNRQFTGSYAKTTLGPTVFSTSEEGIISSPFQQTFRQWTLFIGIIFAISLFLVFFMIDHIKQAMTLLRQAVRKMLDGQFDFKIAPQMTTPDEFKTLANHFDDIAIGLKERVKAYAIMHQAFGKAAIHSMMRFKEEDFVGHHRQVTVLHCDFSHILSMCEGDHPAKILTTVNETIEVLMRMIDKHQGWVEHVDAESLSVVWGVHEAKDSDTEQALFCALDIRLAIEGLNNLRVATGLKPLRIGMGVHHGEAIIGRVGSHERSQLRVFGDIVKHAARIESSTKVYGFDLLISEITSEKISDVFWLEQAGFHYVKGKALAFSLFKVRGYRVWPDINYKEIKTPYSEFVVDGDEEVTAA
jgi:adenylate cyclase